MKMPTNPQFNPPTITNTTASQSKSNKKVYNQQIAMNNIKLNKEEKEILEAFDLRKLKRTKNVEKEKRRYQQVARQTFSKPRSINIRLSERDLQKVKALAAEKGLPYQTFISSLLHQLSDKKTKEATF